MSNIIQLPSWVLVRVPEGAHSPRIQQGDLLSWGILNGVGFDKLPPGNYGEPYLASDMDESEVGMFASQLLNSGIEHDLSEGTWVAIPILQPEKEQSND